MLGEPPPNLRLVISKILRYSLPLFTLVDKRIEIERAGPQSEEEYRDGPTAVMYASGSATPSADERGRRTRTATNCSKYITTLTSLFDVFSLFIQSC